MTVSGIRGYMARGFFTVRLYIPDTDLLLVDVVYHYHQGEGILAGVSNEHHLPLLVLQVTAVLVLNRFECFNFPKYRSTNFKAIFPFLQAFCLSPLISLFMSLKLYTMAMDLALYLLLWFGGPHYINRFKAMGIGHAHV